MCVWSRWTEKIKTAWSLFISLAWLTPPHRFTKMILSILAPLLKAEPGHWPIRIHQAVFLVCQRLFAHGRLRKKEKKARLLFVCLPVCRIYKAEFCEIWSRGHEQGKNPFWCCVLEICKDYYHGFAYKLHIKDEWTTGLGRGLLWPRNAIINPE